ncbi:MAG: hypothetical protein H6816_14190 [Phycisphaerales bacterium]|nr:hypothetical protein [Phycisphaerales bacterium]
MPGWRIDTAKAAPPVFTEEEGAVRVTFTIDEGTQFIVGRIVVRGNERTQTADPPRTRLYPGELFDLPEVCGIDTHPRPALFRDIGAAPAGDLIPASCFVNIYEGPRRQLHSWLRRHQQQYRRPGSPPHP